MIGSKPIMTVKEARKLLGIDYQKLDDEKIAELIEQLHELAKLSLDMAREQHLKKTLGNSSSTN
jgi:uncharacterized protein YutE (UPF0331/DUF86 family)